MVRITTRDDKDWWALALTSWGATSSGLAKAKVHLRKGISVNAAKGLGSRNLGVVPLGDSPSFCSAPSCRGNLDLNP